MIRKGKIGSQIWSAFTEDELFAPVLKTMDRSGHTPQFDRVYCIYRKHLTKRYGSINTITFRARALYKRKRDAQLCSPEWPERVSAAPLLAYCQEYGTDISEAHRAAVENLCAEAVRNRKPIDSMEVPPDTRGLLNALAGNWRRGYVLMGIPLVRKGQMRNIRRSKDRAKGKEKKE